MGAVINKEVTPIGILMRGRNIPCIYTCTCTHTHTHTHTRTHTAIVVTVESIEAITCLSCVRKEQNY